MTADLLNPIFTNEEAARAHFEAIRWPNGAAFCPHCGATDVVRSKGKSVRAGLWHCRACFEPFSVTVGTVMERSHIKLHKWALAFHLMAASKKGISAHQLHRMLGVTYKTAWFLCHRIREAMTDAAAEPLGGPGKVVEIDETYYGKLEGPAPTTTKAGRPYTKGGTSGVGRKRAIVALVERGAEVRSFHIQHHPTKEDVAAVLARNADKRSRLHTDESGLYRKVGEEFAEHAKVYHGRMEYVRGDVHTNTIEGFFSIFKRGMTGVYQHCAEKHLHRYLVEFDFRYNNRVALGIDDKARAANAIAGIVGKRLTYRETKG